MPQLGRWRRYGAFISKAPPGTPPPPTTPSVRGTGALTTVTTAGTSYVLNVPAGRQSGDVLLASITFNAHASFVAGQEFGAGDSGVPAGWTKIYNDSAGTTVNYSMHVFQRTADGTEPSTYTWTAAQAVTGSGSIIAIKDASATLDATQTWTGNTAAITATLTTVTNHDLIVSFAGMDSGSTVTYTSGPASSTEQWGYTGSVGQRNACATILDVTPAGGQSLTWTASAAGTQQGAWAAGLALAGGGSPQTVSPTAISTAESVSVAKVTAVVTPVPVMTGELVGAVAVTQVVSPTSIQTSEFLGAAVTTATVALSPSGTVSSETVGTAQVSVTVSAVGIRTEERGGNVTVTPGVVTLSPNSISSSEVLGTATVAVAGAPQTVSPSGIQTTEVLGTVQTTLFVTPAPVTTNEAFGATLTAQVISTVGIRSSETAGTGTTTLTVTPTGIPTAQLLGSASIAQSVSAIGITTVEVVGTATTTPGTATVSPNAIQSAEIFGTAFTAIAAAQTVSPIGVQSVETLGTASVAQALQAVGIISTEKFGTATVTPGTVTISPASVRSDEAFGVQTLTLTVAPVGTKSTETFGTVSVSVIVSINPHGISTTERFGSTAVAGEGVTLTTAGIASEAAFGVLQVVLGEIAEPKIIQVTTTVLTGYTITVPETKITPIATSVLEPV